MEGVVVCSGVGGGSNVELSVETAVSLDAFGVIPDMN